MVYSKNLLINVYYYIVLSILLSYFSYSILFIISILFYWFITQYYNDNPFVTINNLFIFIGNKKNIY
jgi:hypothetical protein